MSKKAPSRREFDDCSLACPGLQFSTACQLLHHSRSFDAGPVRSEAAAPQRKRASSAGPRDGAINDAIKAACAPGGAIRTMMEALISASCAPGGETHRLVHNSEARLVNPWAAATGAPLTGLLLPDGSGVAPGFPGTTAALEALTGAELSALLQAYGQPVPKSLPAKLAAFKALIGVRS